MASVTTHQPVAVPDLMFFGIERLTAELFGEMIRRVSLDCLRVSKWTRSIAIELLIFDCRLTTREARFRLMAAIRHGLLPFVKSLVKYPGIGTWSDLGTIACWHGQLEVFKFVTCIEEVGSVIEKFALWMNNAIPDDQVAIVQYLLDVHPDARTTKEFADYAARCASVKVLRLFSQYQNFDVDAALGKYLCEWAAFGSLDKIKRANDRGVSLSWNLNGAFIAAARGAQTKVLEYLAGIRGVDPTDQNGAALREAIHHDNTRVLSLLLNLPVDWKLEHYHPQHPLKHAIDIVNAEAVVILAADKRIREAMESSPEFTIQAQGYVAICTNAILRCKHLDILEHVGLRSYKAGSVEYTGLVQYLVSKRSAVSHFLPQPTLPQLFDLLGPTDHRPPN